MNFKRITYQLVFVLFLLSSFKLSLAQTPTQNDCAGAIPVCLGIYNEPNSYPGTGNIPNEIDGFSSCLGGGEVDGAWYVFSVQVTGDLCFSITPNDLTDDYDWAVYNISNNPCSDIATDPSLEVSCNFSGSAGVTGANGQAGTQNEPCIPVVLGETYVLYVSNWTQSPNGYVLDFTQSSANIGDGSSPFLESVDVNGIACGDNEIDLIFSENILCTSVDITDFSIILPDGSSSPIIGITSINCTAGGNYDMTFTAELPFNIIDTGDYSVVISGTFEDLCGNVATVGDIVDFTAEPSFQPITFAEIPATCNVATDGEITATYGSSNSPITYLWSDASNQTTQTATGLLQGPYSVTVTDALGCINSQSFTLTFNPNLTAITFSESPASCDAPDGSITASFSSTNTPFTYLWSDGNSQTTQTATGLTQGSYTVTAIDALGCSNENSHSLSYSPILLATLTLNENAGCEGQSNGSLFVNIANGTSPYSYNWSSSGSNQPNLTGLPVGVYDVTVSSDENCLFTGSETITESPATNFYMSQNIPATCHGLCTGQAEVTVVSGASPYTFIWPSNSTSSFGTGLCAGVNKVYVENNYGCIDSLNITITQPVEITVTISGDDTLCYSQSTTLTAFAIGGNGNFNYIWNSGQNTASIVTTPSNTSEYSVFAVDILGCLADTLDTIFVYEPLSLNMIDNDTICNGDSIFVYAQAFGGDGNYVYTWTEGLSSGDTLAVAPVNDKIYTITLTDGCGSPDVIQDLNVAVGQYPIFVLYPPSIEEGCSPQFSEFFIDTIIPYHRYTWGFGDGTYINSDLKHLGHLYTDPGCYDVSLNVTSNYGCSVDTTIYCAVEIYPNPTADFSLTNYRPDNTNPSTTCIDESILADYWQWDFGDGETSNYQHVQHTYNDSGTYTIVLAVETDHGCKDTTELTINVDFETILYTPNSFSPNGDGLNDIFLPVGEGIDPDSYSLQIFNRWGTRIFITSDPTTGWDGTSTGTTTIAEEGVYVYRLDFKRLGESKASFAIGPITLIK